MKSFVIIESHNMAMQLPVMMIGKIMRIMAWFHKNFKTVPPHIRIFIQFISNFYSVFI